MNGTEGDQYDYLVVEEFWPDEELFPEQEDTYINDIALLASFEDPRDALDCMEQLIDEEAVSAKDRTTRFAVYQRYAGEPFGVMPGGGESHDDYSESEMDGCNE